MAENFKKKVLLNTVINTIKTSNDCVCVTVEDGKVYCGDYAIVTFSIGVLQAAIRDEDNTVKFDPPLPEEKQEAINNVTLVYYERVYMQFNE